MADFTQVTPKKVSSSLQANLTAALENIADPTNTRRTFVYQSEPRRKSGSFDDYPYIYIEDYSAVPQSRNVDGLVTRFDASAQIVVEATDDSASAKAQFDSIVDELIYAFETGQVQSLRENGISVKGEGYGISSNQRFTGIDEADQPIIRREIGIDMRMHLDMGDTS